MEKIVITGATGFLGRNVARKFLDQGALVYAVVRPESTNSHRLPVHPNLIPVRSALEDLPLHREEIGRADGFFHFAWGGVNREEIDSPQVQAQNVAASLACVEAARLLGCSVFMDAGSRVEYGVTDQVMKEELECHPINQYGKAKLEFYEKARTLCEACGLTYYHLRFFSVYGFGDHPWSIISTLVRELPRGGNAALSACLHKWNFMYIDDAARAVLELYRRAGDHEGETWVVNVAGADTRRLKSFVEEIREIAGKGTLEYGSFAQAKEGALSVVPDISRLLSLAGGFKERYTFREGILEMIEKEVEQEDEENKCTDPLL